MTLPRQAPKDAIPAWLRPDLSTTKGFMCETERVALMNLRKWRWLSMGIAITARSGAEGASDSRA